GDYRSRKSSGIRHHRKLLVEQPHEFRLIQAVDETPHECAQVRRSSGDWGSMPGHIRQQQTADASGSAAGRIVNIPAVLRISVRLAVDPGVEAAERYAA